jgi:hypothetical protein
MYYDITCHMLRKTLKVSSKFTSKIFKISCVKRALEKIF